MRRAAGRSRLWVGDEVVPPADGFVPQGVRGLRNEPQLS